jgi:hypothetical protein
MKKVDGLRYTFVEDDDEHGPFFKILEGKAMIAYAVRRAAALQITRALNREDLRLFAARAKPRPAPHGATSGKRFPRRRFRSKRKLD